MNTTGKVKILALLALATAAGIIIFWAAFFTVGLAPENAPECYLAFEHSFPLPDLVMCAALIAGALLVLKGNPLGRVLLLVCAGSLIFLGLVDFSFNIRNGMYVVSVTDGIMNAFINTWCVGLGVGIVLVLRSEG